MQNGHRFVITGRRYHIYLKQNMYFLSLLHRIQFLILVDFAMIPLEMGSQSSCLPHQLVGQLTIRIWAISSESSLSVGPTVCSVKGVEDIVHAWSPVLLYQLL